LVPEAHDDRLLRPIGDGVGSDVAGVKGDLPEGPMPRALLIQRKRRFMVWKFDGT